MNDSDRPVSDTANDGTWHWHAGEVSIRLPSGEVGRRHAVEAMIESMASDHVLEDPAP